MAPMLMSLNHVPGLGTDDVIPLVLDEVIAYIPGPDVRVLVGVLRHCTLSSCTRNLQCYIFEIVGP